MKTFEGRGHAATDLHGSCRSLIEYSHYPITQDKNSKVVIVGVDSVQVHAGLVHGLGGQRHEIWRDSFLIPHAATPNHNNCKKALKLISILQGLGGISCMDFFFFATAALFELT